MKSPKIWIGVEATKNRVKDQYFCQLRKSGHYHRSSDLELFAELGAEKIRYPGLWEEVCHKSSREFDWQWMDQRYSEIQRVGLSPIVGLLHHGSGPADTSLMDPEMPEKFARYARAFAERYPWVSDYIPVNEILTTARFSGLYGHWYPHKTSDKDYIRALYNQCRASILAMREIRKVNPSARYIQTEDLGRAQGTAPLQYQVDFENARRWSSFDLLLGRVDRCLTLYQHLSQEISEREFAWIQENALAPDLLGINHYPLSNRFLDHRLHLYPPGFHGGNGRDTYADVGAIDTGQTEPPAPYDILKEVWERYKIPYAVTEVHIRGTREKQLRWFQEIWQAAQQLNAEGADLQAVTAWSLLGSYDWNHLCTVDENSYEPGVFDLSSPDRVPQKTFVFDLLKNLSATGQFDHPLFHEENWSQKHRREILFAPRDEVNL